MLRATGSLAWLLLFAMNWIETRGSSTDRTIPRAAREFEVPGAAVLHGFLFFSDAEKSKGVRAENANADDDDNIRETGAWRGILAAVNPRCWSSRVFDLGDDCAEALPVYVGTIALCIVLTACFCHGACRAVKTYTTQLRVEKAGKSTKKKNEGNVCPQGHPLIRHRAQGGKKACDNCHKKIEYTWGCRDCRWGVCQNCHVELLASRQGVELCKPVAPKTPALEAQPMSVEVVLTMEILIEQGNNVHNWFDGQIAEQARIAGIREEFLAQLDQNVEVLDAQGGVYGSYMEFAEQISPEKFPIVFKFSTHATKSVNQASAMDRGGLMKRMSQEFEV